MLRGAWAHCDDGDGRVRDGRVRPRSPVTTTQFQAAYSLDRPLPVSLRLTSHLPLFRGGSCVFRWHRTNRPPENATAATEKGKVRCQPERNGQWTIKRISSLKLCRRHRRARANAA